MTTKAKRLILKASVILMFSTTLTPCAPIHARAKIKLSRSKRTYDTYGSHFWDKIKLKNAPSGAKIRWKSSSSSVIKLADKFSCGTWYRVLKPGKATITALYKGKKYSCRITVKKNSEDPKVTPVPTQTPGQEEATPSPKADVRLNEKDVTIYYCPEYAVPYAHDASHPTQFQFELTGTDEQPVWKVAYDEPNVSGKLIISKSGLLTVSDIGSPDATATVTATLDDRVLSAKVTVVDEARVLYDKKIDEFFSRCISDDMTDVEKVEAVARYIEHEYDYELYQPDWKRMIITGGGDCMASRIGVSELCKKMGFKTYIVGGERLHGRTMVRIGDDIYMTVTGFREAKPRTYWVYKINDEELASLETEFPSCKYYLFE